MNEHADVPTIWSPAQRLMVPALFGLMGAFFWAIRGTSGYGGSDGGTLAGLGWGVLWLAMSGIDGNGDRRPYAGPRMLAAITLGMAFGGMTGYGVYTAWVQGKFYLNFPEGVRAVAPWTGYAMLFFSGLHWGGVTGALMAWCAPIKPPGWRGWVARVAAGVLGAVLAGVIVRAVPQLFLPFYGEGLYEVEEYRTCRRAVGSIRNIAPHVGLYLGFLALEVVRRDWRAVGMMLVMGFGFAIPFAVGGYWHTFHGSEVQLDWWKNWEMSIGLGGGIAIGIAFLLFNRHGTEYRFISVPERILGGGLVLWLGTSSVFSSMLDGLNKIHDLASFETTFTVLAWAWFLFAAAALVWWARTRLRPSGGVGAAMPGPALAATMALIVIAGFAVSTPVPLQLYSKVLLALYVFYIGAGLVLFLALRAGVRRAKVT